MLERLYAIDAQYATFVGMLADSDDPMLVQGAHKLQTRYSPPSLACRDPGDSNNAENGEPRDSDSNSNSNNAENGEPRDGDSDIAGSNRNSAATGDRDNTRTRDYILWLHVVLRKFFEVYAYLHTRDHCDLATVLCGLLTNIMALAPSLHRCSVVAYMDEYIHCANRCAESLDIAPYANRKYLRHVANWIYGRFASGDEVGAADYTLFATEADAVHSHFREMPDCPEHIYTMMCVVHHLAILPMPA